MNTYHALTPAAEAAFSVGTFERELSAAQERDWLAGGHLEIVPRTYRSLSRNYTVPRGETFQAAFPVEIEAALMAGGHIERVDHPTKKTKATDKKD